jgi:hypothetical protein
MIFEVLDRLDEEFTTFAFGTNKDGDVFVQGKNTGLKVEGPSVDEAYTTLKEVLLKKKLIKYVPTE